MVRLDLGIEPVEVADQLGAARVVANRLGMVRSSDDAVRRPYAEVALGRDPTSEQPCKQRLA